MPHVLKSTLEFKILKYHLLPLIFIYSNGMQFQEKFLLPILQMFYTAHFIIIIHDTNYDLKQFLEFDEYKLL